MSLLLRLLSGGPMSVLGGWLWMLSRFGVRRTLRYAKARHEGVVIDYSQVFTADELAKLGEHSSPAPWESR